MFVNGTSVSLGPARSDLDHWRFETIDIAAHLSPGRNVLAAVVWNFRIWSPMAQHSERTAFIVQGDSEREQIVNTSRGLVASPRIVDRVEAILQEADGPLTIAEGDHAGTKIVRGNGAPKPTRLDEPRAKAPAQGRRRLGRVACERQRILDAQPLHDDDREADAAGDCR